MKFTSFAPVVVAATVFLSIGCKDRTYDSSVSSEKSQDKIDPRAYNAYHLWTRTFLIDISGETSHDPDYVNLKKEPITEFPKKYDVKSGSAGDNELDDVFFVHPNSWREKGEFISAPTKLYGERIWTPDVGWHSTDVGEQPKVEGDTLNYPSAPKPLRLKFSTASETAYKHNEAVKYCKKKNGRLPTAREIFDFCVMGLKEGSFGKNNSYAQNKNDPRCAKQDLWTVSLNFNDVSTAWRFDSNDGDLDTKSRDNSYLVRCVLF